MQATECENPFCTVAFGCLRLRKQSSQLIMCEGSSSPISIVGSVFFMIALLFHHLPARAAFAAAIDHRGLLSHDSRKSRRVIAEACRVAPQVAAWIGE